MDIFVRPGDSFWNFSQVFKMPLQLIIDSNRNINPQVLTVGQQIKIPGFVATNYKIQTGDSLWLVAQRRNLPLYALLLANPNLEPNRLQVGQMIKIPQRITWRLINGKQNYDYDIMMNDIRRLLAVYPFLQTPSIGNSVLRRGIPEIVVGSGTKRVHYNASFHANEWITTPIVLTFLNDYLLSLTNQTTIRGL